MKLQISERILGNLTLSSPTNQKTNQQTNQPNPLNT